VTIPVLQRWCRTRIEAYLTGRKALAATNPGYGEMVAVGLARGAHSGEPLPVKDIGERREVLPARAQLLSDLIVSLAGVARP